jgi:hypothetical protein
LAGLKNTPKIPFVCRLFRHWVGHKGDSFIRPTGKRPVQESVGKNDVRHFVRQCCRQRVTVITAHIDSARENVAFFNSNG